jgi:hypothetical protein
MKKCDYCGRQNDDAATWCRECGSADFATEARLKPVMESRKPEPDEVPLAAFAEKSGNFVKLRCRTPSEAYLVSDELGKDDIITILPEAGQLLSDYRQNGYVELRVSAKAYESVADLRWVVEFQYKQLLRADRPLPLLAKAMAMGCAIMIVPGLLVFTWFLSSYRKNGYNRMAKELKLWFLLGIASWLLVLVGLNVTFKP